MRSRVILKHHFFFTLSQAELHSGLLYPVSALQGQQLLQESSESSLSCREHMICHGVVPVALAFPTPLFLMLFAPSSSPCTKFLPFFTQAFPELPLPPGQGSALPARATWNHLRAAQTHPDRSPWTKLLEFLKEKPSKYTRSSTQNAVA